MTALGLYLPGRSALHRTPAGWKLSALLLVGLGSVWTRQPWPMVLLLGSVLLGYAVAGVPIHLVLRSLRSLSWLLLAIGVGHWLLHGQLRALSAVGVLLTLVLAANLVTLTTRTTDLLDVTTSFARRFRRLGVDPDQVALYLALAIRSVPVVLALAAEIRDAQLARGAESSVRAFAVPLIVRVLLHADHLGEALAARGAVD